MSERKKSEPSGEPPEESRGGGEPEKWGPYELFVQLVDSRHGQGELYLATHEESGAGALVLKPNAEQVQGPQGSSDWHMSYSSSGSPGYLALEVERSPWVRHPGSPSAEELVCALGDLRAGVERMTQMLVLRYESRPWGLRVGLGLAGVAAACALVFALVREEPMQGLGGSGPVATAAQEALSAQGTAAVEPPDTLYGVFAGAMHEEPLLLAWPLPREPLKGQKRPPCTPYREVELVGACWVPHKLKAPCPVGLYEHQGECYVPVSKPQGAPPALGQ